MAKIKHWQGYGSVEAKKMSRKVSKDGIATLKICVKGNHEWGLKTDDPYHIYNWLVSRFDKSAVYHPNMFKTIDTNDYYVTEKDENNHDVEVEVCEYFLEYNPHGRAFWNLTGF